MKEGLAAARFEEKLSSVVGSEVGCLGAAWHWLGVNKIAVIVIEDENVLVATDGGDEETASGVSVDLAGG